MVKCPLLTFLNYVGEYLKQILQLKRKQLFIFLLLLLMMFQLAIIAKLKVKLKVTGKTTADQ